MAGRTINGTSRCAIGIEASGGITFNYLVVSACWCPINKKRKNCRSLRSLLAMHTRNRQITRSYFNTAFCACFDVP